MPKDSNARKAVLEAALESLLAYLHAKSSGYKNLDLLESVLFSHGFLLFCDAF